MKLTEELNCRSDKEVNPNPKSHFHSVILDKTNRQLHSDLMETWYILKQNSSYSACIEDILAA